MGDRAVVGVRENSTSPTIFLYLHWAGSEQDAMLGEALQAAHSRIEMGDAAYATRIIFSAMTEGLEGELGAGMYVGGTHHGADYYTINIVDIEAKRVLVCQNDNSDEVEMEWTIDDFIRRNTARPIRV